MGKDRLICNGVTYTGDNLLSGNCFIGNSIAGDELAIDTLTATVRSQGISLTGLPYGTPVFYYHGDTLIGKFYLNAVARSSRDNYDLSCVSGVGLLDAVQHYGGLYAGETVEEALNDIIGGIVPYTVSPGVGAVRVYGWLPVATRRDNLRQLLFATGAALKKDTAGEINISLLNVDAPQEISDDRLFSGGSVEYRAPVSEVVVLEHGYIITSTDEDATLYDDAVTGQDIISPKGAALNGVMVTFDGPMHDLSVEGGTILEAGVNYAVLAPSGQTTLKGKKYTHTTREVRAAVASAVGEQNVARVEEATLVNLTNSESVAKRVADYYSMSRTIRMGMVMGAERPGDAVTLSDPFDELVTGLLMSQDINMSNTLVAQAEMVAGYTPEHEGVYEHVVVLTGSGTWTPPEGVKKIHVVLIGSGAGGGAGENGRNGSATSLWFVWTEDKTGFTRTVSPGKGGIGGKGGTGGLGGNIIQKTLEVTPGEVIVYSAPLGGDGGSADSPNGKPGVDTVFGMLTSADGSPSRVGYTDVFSGVTYGASGVDGVAGGNGGDGSSYPDRGNTGGAAGEYEGGHGGSSVQTDTTASGGELPGTVVAQKWYYGGFGGGGGAIGGSFGTDFYAGGSAASVADAPNYGCGGNGGHGGGGGGGSPGIRLQVTYGLNSGGSRDFASRAGGKGSAGGAGAPGCILIYY